jgi:hypothetical protein
LVSVHSLGVGRERGGVTAIVRPGDRAGFQTSAPRF